MLNKTIRLELKNAPLGTPPAWCSATPSLNSPQRDSVAEGAVSYPAEVDQPKVKSGQVIPAIQMTRVFVLSNQDKPLMPTTPRKAKKLLKEGKAEVVSARPFFTIKLKHDTRSETQPITLGLDPGYGYIGFALVGQECYLAGHIKVDNKMSERLEKRAMHRRNRRGRLRYRPARWQNRANSRKKGKLPPSVQRRTDRHIKLIKKLESICPITEKIIEGGSFDIQKAQNPEIQGKGYQEGALHRSNLRHYYIQKLQ